MGAACSTLWCTPLYTDEAVILDVKAAATTFFKILVDPNAMMIGDLVISLRVAFVLDICVQYTCINFP